MRKIAKFASVLGCLVSVVAPVIALVLYPRANWLIAFVLIGVLVLVLNDLLVKDPTPQALADEIERLLTGNFGGWDVDDFECQRIRDPQLRDLWRKSMEVGGLPEKWFGLAEEQKGRLRDVVREIRELGEAKKH